MPQPVQMPGGLLNVTFGYDTLPLGFGLRLDKFNHEMNPGGMGDAAFTSTVQVVDSAGAISAEAEISMNHPLVHGKFAFYQSGMRPESNGTILTAAYDPGSKLKYLGSLLVCLGMLVTFCTKTLLTFAKSPTPDSRSHQGCRMRTSIAIILTLLTLGGSAGADPADRAGFDWKPWRSLAVQDGGLASLWTAWPARPGDCSAARAVSPIRTVGKNWTPRRPI